MTDPNSVATAYQSALTFLYSRLPMFQQVGAPALKMGLRNIQALSAALGGPHTAYPTVHIAGTNGKGSTAHLIAAGLQAAGYRVGLYTSPHYRDFRERIKVNGTYISEEAVAAFVERHRATIEEVQPSYFEMTVAMAFDYFRAAAVDVAIIETGLGGATDSTNIITPILSVITNVSYDHMQVLGDTLPAIASVKAGIIKPSVPVVIGEHHPETDPVWEARAATEASALTYAQDAVRVVEKGGDYRSTTFGVTAPFFAFEEIEAQVFGNYQVCNVGTALAALVALRAHFEIPDAAILSGFGALKSLTAMIGRWDVLAESPLTLTDSGHNEAGVRYIVSQLERVPHRTLHIVWGVVHDKAIDKMLSLLPRQAKYYFTRPQVPRGLAADSLQAQAQPFGLVGEVYDTVALAWEAARQAASPDDLIFIGGSSFVVAEVV